MAAAHRKARFTYLQVKLQVVDQKRHVIAGEPYFRLEILELELLDGLLEYEGLMELVLHATNRQQE
jgi:hypothetical protein